MPCKSDDCPNKGKRDCKACVDWVPSQNSRYYKCLRYLSSRILCTEPIENCAECPHRIPKGKVGRPTELGIELKPGMDRTEYMREYMRVRRKKRNVN